MRIALVSVLVFALWAVQPLFGIDIVAEGVGRAVIVIPTTASDAVKDAAGELQNYVKKITGAELPIAQEGVQPQGPSIWVGSTKRSAQIGLGLEALKPEGFCIKTVNDDLFIVGKDDVGTRYGVDTFLEKYCGVRWFMPGELGEVVPRSAKLSVGEINDIENPDFIHRQVWWAYGKFPLGQKEAYTLWQLRNKMGGVKLNAGHNLMRIVPRKRFFATHPEYFPLINGLRRCDNEGDNWQPCTSNPAVVTLAVEAALDYFEKYPDAYSFSVSPNDGYGWCMCSNCTGLDPPEYREDPLRGKGRRMLLFANAVAEQVSKKFPDKYIAFYAYAGTVEPPSDVKAHPNVVVALAHYGWCGCNFHPIESPDCPANAKFRPIVEGWGKITDKLFIREYFLTLANPSNSLMRIAGAHSIARDIPYFKRHKVIGINSESVREYGIAALNFYVAAKFMWNAETDESALLDDYYTKFYGPAADPMRRYFEGIAEYTRQNVHKPGPKFPPEFLAVCRAYLDEAAKAAAASADPTIAKRVEEARIYFDFFNMGRENLGPNATPESIRAYFARANELKDTNIIEYNIFARTLGKRAQLIPPPDALYAGQRLVPFVAQTPASKTCVPFPLLRGVHVFWVMVKAGETLRFEVTNRRLGSYFDFVNLAVYGPDKKTLLTGEVGITEKQKFEVMPEIPGIYTLILDSGQNAVEVRIENVHAVLKGDQIHFLGAARRPLYFFVPKELRAFFISLTGEGGETGAVDVLNPEGVLVATGSTVPKGSVKIEVIVPTAFADKVWSLIVKPAESGITEDIRLGLDPALPPFLALDPASLLVSAQ